MFEKVFSRFVTIICLWLAAGLAVASAQQLPPSGQVKADRPEEAKTSNPGLPSTDQASSGKAVKGDGPILKEYTDIVTFTVTVTDPYNRLVTGLDRQNFEVYENKVKQNIEFFKDDDAPVSLGIIFDVSGSMKGKLDRAREALKALIQTSHDQDDFFLIGFNQRANLLAEYCDANAMLGKLTLIDPRGQTALYDAAYLGVEKAQQGRYSRRALVIISDGQDNSSRYTWNELRKVLKEADVQVYCIGIAELGGGAGSMLDLQGQSILEEIAQVTGGKAFFPRGGAELEDATTRIALELRHQYSIGYVPTSMQRDGKWHKIKVQVKAPRGMSSLAVRAKDGYYATPGALEARK